MCHHYQAASARGRREALVNIREAIELYLEPVEDDYVLQGDSEVLELAL